MSEVAILPFHWSHVLCMQLRDPDRQTLEAIPDWLDRVKEQGTASVAFTAFDGPIVACSWGFRPLWPGVMEAWLLTAFHVEHRPHAFVRAAKRTIEAVCSQNDIHRLQIAVRGDNLVAHRFARFLQFEPEGLMKSYGPDGSDHFMMARVRDGSSIRGRQQEQQRHDGAANGISEQADGDPADAAGSPRRTGT